jgi:DNA-binding response OmpR family regulator
MILKEDGFTGFSTYQDPHLNISFQRRKVMLDGRNLVLTRKEYELLALLCQNAGEIVPRGVLLQQVWGYGEGIRTRTLDVHIRRLRKKLAPFSDRYIETIFGVGYRFQPFRARAVPLGLRPAIPVPAIA